MNPVEVKSGSSPVVLGLPHTGTYVPPEVRDRLSDRGRLLTDTDWDVHELYDDLLSEATTVRATFHRYVIDANRDPSGKSLYPGQNTTSLIPLTDFDGENIWAEAPQDHHTAQFLNQYHDPYHAALQKELDRVRMLHGFAILFDCHSIRSKIPFLFEGTLPDFNIGTNDSRTCAKQIEDSVVENCRLATDYDCVLNGRFKGGWTTRHYGRPEQCVHAIQMELAQSTYLQTESAPFAYCPSKSKRLRKHLRKILHDLATLHQNEHLTQGKSYFQTS